MASSAPAPAAAGARSRRRLVIDTDGGCDDAIAILLALRACGDSSDPAATAGAEVEVLALTSVFGNVSMAQATENVYTLLRVFDRLDSIPFYAGAAGPLVDPSGRGPLGTWPGHGGNGLGDASFLDGAEEVHDHQAYQRRVQEALGKKHAVQALIDLSFAHAHELDLVCLGPLTNIALAVRLDPSFPSRVRSFTFMGGSVWGKGNANLSAEFNLVCDPDAAHVALTEMARAGVQSLCIPWEATESAWVSWSEFDLLTRGHEEHIPGNAATKHALEASVLKKTHAKYELVCRGAPEAVTAAAAEAAKAAAATPDSAAAGPVEAASSTTASSSATDVPLSPARDHPLSSDQINALNEIPSLTDLLRSLSSAAAKDGAPPHHADPFLPAHGVIGAPVQSILAKNQYVCCDAIALACLLVPSIVAHSEQHHTQVTLLADEETRGTLAIDWYDKKKPAAKESQDGVVAASAAAAAAAEAVRKGVPYSPVTIVTSVHRERWLALLHSVFQGGRNKHNTQQA